ncbi:MAG: hypothetical protein ABSD99_10100 [Candidatus Bathyarchaeia archaeon]|jgi:uncharacterized membrane protein YozB (DUF420 family)
MTPIRRVVALLLALQVIATGYLWMGNAVETVSDARFAVFLGVNLLSLSIVAYIYTHDKWGAVISRVWILVASLGLILLLLSTFYFP